MSGRKNHIVPQLLLRGFGVEKKSNHQVWVHSKDKDAFCTSIGNYGAQRDYFVQEGDASVDVSMTDFEGTVFSEFVRTLRNADNSVAINNDVAARVLTHIFSRTKPLRDEMSRISQSFFKELSDDQNLDELMSEFDQGYVSELVSEFISEQNLDEDHRRLTRAYYDIFGRDFHAEVSEHVRRELKDLTQLMGDYGGSISKKAQLKVLGREDASTNLFSSLKMLSFRMVEFDVDDLILGDTMLVFLDRYQKCSPFGSADLGISEIYLPISSRKALHGYIGKPIERSLCTINRILASTSYNNFISRSNTHSYLALTKRIGKNAKLLKTKDMRLFKK